MDFGWAAGGLGSYTDLFRAAKKRTDAFAGLPAGRSLTLSFENAKMYRFRCLPDPVSLYFEVDANGGTSIAGLGNRRRCFLGRTAGTP